MFLSTLSAKYAESFCLLKMYFLLSHEKSLSGCFFGLWFFILQSVQPVHLNYNTSLHQWYYVQIFWNVFWVIKSC
jgi:hypothetical protein